MRIFCKKEELMDKEPEVTFNMDVYLSYKGGAKCAFTQSVSTTEEAQTTYANYIAKLTESMTNNSLLFLDSVGIRGEDLQYFIVDEPKKRKMINGE